MFKSQKIMSLMLALLLVFSLSTAVFAFSEAAPTEDVSGGEDHPLISRFPDSYLRYYEQNNYDEFNIPLNRLGAEDIASDYSDYKEKGLNLEGKVTKSLYIVQQEHSTLEIFRNYEAALEEAGFEVIAKRDEKVPNNFSNRLYDQTNFKDAEETEFEGVDQKEDSARYMLAKTSREEGDVYLSLYVANHGFYGGSWPDGTPAVFQTVIEEKDLETDKIEVNRDFESRDRKESSLSDDLPLEDVSDSRDHPLLSRIPGSYLRYYDEVSYDEFTMAFSELNDAEIESDYQDSELQLEGQLTKSLYIIPDNYSTLEVFRNYETAVEEAGFEIIAKKEGEVSESFSNSLYDQTNFKDAEETGFEAVDNRSQNAYYLAAKMNRAEGEVHLSLYVGEHGFYGGGWPDGLPAVFQVIVEEKDLETDLIDVEGVMKDIESRGRASIQGIYFDHDSASIKDESTPNLEKIAELLNENSELKLYVVGHTDNTGELEYNMDLSQKRAEALVERLVSEYNISSERLIPAGVGPLNPAATNETEEGRSENRRVELVKSNY